MSMIQEPIRVRIRTITIADEDGDPVRYLRAAIYADDDPDDPEGKSGVELARVVRAPLDNDRAIFDRFKEMVNAIFLDLILHSGKPGAKTAIVVEQEPGEG